MQAELITNMVFHVLGGLGIFLLGMRNLSDGLQTVAGSGLRKIIAALTQNRIFAVFAGIFVTMIIQSSSITSVMTVGFVNSGIMSLSQAIGVIMGANIGTTFTAWILVLAIGKWGLPLMGGAAFFYLFSKQEKMKYIALTLMGVGMVFFGLELMKDGFKPIRSMPEFKAMFHMFHADSYLNVLIIAAIGCVLTLLVQSSSATIGITFALASQGIINFETAAALVMGENIGTTITALLASIGTSINARKTAYFHVFFNVTGVLWITAIFSLYLPVIRWILLTFFGVEDVNAQALNDAGEVIYPSASLGIATVHSVFNITNVLLFLPFTRIIANVLDRVVKERPEKAPKKFLTNLDFHIYESPVAALEQADFELNRMSMHTRTMMDHLEIALRDSDEDAIKKVFDREEILDTVQHEVTEFLTELLSSPTSIDVADEARIQLRVCDELESISDYITQVLKHNLRLQKHESPFHEDQLQEILELHRQNAIFFNKVREFTDHPENANLRSELDQMSLDITNHVRELRASHWERLSEMKYAPLISTSYTDTIHSYRKIKNHLMNVVEAIAGEK